jgi:hypothetical protein
MSVTAHQKFTYREIARAAITNAPYNPRKISDYARRKLRKQLLSGGLVETLVWNERTGHLVSGHQRLNLLDDLERGEDYTVGVAVVDLDDATERTQNVFFNNIYAQGTYDEERFVAVVQEGATLEGMGFTVADLEQEFGLVPALDPSFASMREAQTPVIDAIREVERSRTFRAVDETVKATNTEVDGYTDSDYTLAIVFTSADDRDAFAVHYGVDEKYLWTADQLLAVLDEQYQWRENDGADQGADVRVSGDSADADHAGAVQPAAA